jgi:hypothetical protein
MEANLIDMTTTGVQEVEAYYTTTKAIAFLVMPFLVLISGSFLGNGRFLVVSILSLFVIVFGSLVLGFRAKSTIDHMKNPNNYKVGMCFEHPARKVRDSNFKTLLAARKAKAETRGRIIVLENTSDGNIYYNEDKDSYSKNFTMYFNYLTNSPYLQVKCSDGQLLLLSRYKSGDLSKLARK